MSKNWRYEGLVTDYKLDQEAQIQTIINQGSSLIEYADKIKNGVELTRLERENIALFLLEAGQKLIKSSKNIVSKKENGRTPNLLRYEILLRYYLALRVLNKKAHARFLVACSYAFTIDSDSSEDEKIIKLDENIRSWEKEDATDLYIKKQADTMVINKPESIEKAYYCYKKKWKK